MKQTIIEKIVLPFLTDFITKLLTQENFKVWGDKLFDIVEQAIADSETKLDDTFALPVVQRFRELLSIPDLPDNGG